MKTFNFKLVLTDENDKVVDEHKLSVHPFHYTGEITKIYTEDVLVNAVVDIVTDHLHQQITNTVVKSLVKKLNLFEEGK